VAAQNLLYLAEFTGNIELEEKAQQLFRAFGREIVDYPVGYSFFLQAVFTLYGKSICIT
jgi:uncharacterized protein YyaL (SSP411 family)